jgi:hypothetical protein
MQELHRMSKIKVKIDSQWIEINPENIKADEYTFLHNSSIVILKRKMIESRIDSYARGKVSEMFIKPFPGTGTSAVSVQFRDLFEYDLQDGNVYLKDHDGYAADENGRVTMERYFDRKPELLEPMKSHR